VQNVHTLANTKTPVAQFAQEVEPKIVDVILNKEFGSGVKIDAANNSLVFEDLSLAVSLLDKAANAHKQATIKAK
jgi:hypothetical protein